MQSEPSAARIRSSPVPPPHATTAMPFSLLYLLKFVPGANPDTDEPSWSSGLVQWRVRPSGAIRRLHNQFGQGGTKVIEPGCLLAAGNRTARQTSRSIVVRLTWGRVRIVVHWLVFTAERQLELAGDLRPEFTEHVEAYVFEDVVAHRPCCRRDAACVPWVIEVAQHNAACRPQPFGKIEHAPARVAVCHECVLY